MTTGEMTKAYTPWGTVEIAANLRLRSYVKLRGSRDHDSVIFTYAVGAVDHVLLRMSTTVYDVVRAAWQEDVHPHGLPIGVKSNDICRGVTQYIGLGRFIGVPVSDLFVGEVFHDYAH